MAAVLEQLKGRLIVSCQASPGDPLEDSDALRRMALSAISGGAAGLRLDGANQVALLRRDTLLPIIGIHKQYGPAGLHITPDFAAAASLAQAGASIIAVDCTDRTWPDGEPWQVVIQRIHEELHLPVMADVSTFAEAMAAATAGADCVGSTLNGYTEYTRANRRFSWALLAEMARGLRVPIMAEGHISTPDEAQRALNGGAWCVIVGSAITRPAVITGTFLRAIEQPTSSGSDAEACAIGADIGGTSVKAGLVYRNGRVCHPVLVPTDAARGRDAIASALVQAVERVQALAEEERSEPLGLGIATAGAVDDLDGSIFAATENLPGWAGFPLRAFAEQHLRLPVFVVNDAQAAALSELHFGHGRGISDLASITIGTGIGGGIVTQGRLLRGRHGFAGSIGHMVIRAGGLPCNCGRHGCLEAYVSTAALLRSYREHSMVNGRVNADQAGNDTALALRINHLARAGDPAAIGAYGQMSAYLAEGIANLFNLTDTQLVLLSGGLIEGLDGYLEGFVSSVEAQVTKLLHFGAKRQPKVAEAMAGRFAGVQGAATLVFESSCTLAGPAYAS